MLAFIGKVGKAALVLLKLAFVLSVVSGFFVLGMAYQKSYSHITNWSELCFVPDAITVFCQREDAGDAYIWKVIALKNEGWQDQEVLVIQHRVPKNEVGFRYAF